MQYKTKTKQDKTQTEGAIINNESTTKDLELNKSYLQALESLYLF